ncbi:MAG: hypothetical protein AAB342_05395, partial [Chloroflexota bacterium]
PNRIPEWILEADDTLLPFLAGYTDAEGHFGISGGKARFALASGDSEILKQAHVRLSKLGVICPPPYIWLKRGYVNSAGVTTHRDIWRLGVYRANSLSRLIKLLAPHLRHAKRRRDMEKVQRHLQEKGTGFS